MSARTEVVTMGRLLHPMVGNRHIYLTHHAVDAMSHRNVTISELHLVLTEWEQRWMSTRHRGVPQEDTWMYQRGNLGVVVKELDSILLVKTVLLREQRQWSDSDARARDRN